MGFNAATEGNSVEGVESVGRRGAGRVLVGAVGSSTARFLDDAVLATNATARFPGHGRVLVGTVGQYRGRGFHIRFRNRR
jgi:hypothetical protein